MKRKFTVLVVPAAVLLLVSVSVLSFDKPDGAEEYPFFPSLIRVIGDRILTVDDTTDPDTCGACHGEIFEQWNGSMHSKAFRDPVWQEMWKIAHEETGGRIGTECLSCHSPIGMVTGNLKTPGDIEGLDYISASGVQCDFCHSVDSTHYVETREHEPHNMAFNFDPGDVKRGPFKDSESSFHESRYSQLHTSAEFCGNCHNVFHPSTGFPVERTYDEWKQSVYAHNGVVCQDCHMSPAGNLKTIAETLKRVENPGYASELAEERPHIFTHQFTGGNSLLPKLLGSEKHSGIAESMLKNAARVSIEDIRTEKGLVEVDVKVENIAAGHNLPTSLTELRQMWLEVEVFNENGDKIFESGVPDADGNLPEGTVIFNSYPVDKNGG